MLSTVEVNGDELALSTKLLPSAPMGFSYTCSKTLVFKNKEFALQLSNIQVRVQPFFFVWLAAVAAIVQQKFIRYRSIIAGPAECQFKDIFGSIRLCWIHNGIDLVWIVCWISTIIGSWHWFGLRRFDKGTESVRECPWQAAYIHSSRIKCNINLYKVFKAICTSLLRNKSSDF